MLLCSVTKPFVFERIFFTAKSISYMFVWVVGCVSFNFFLFHIVAFFPFFATSKFSLSFFLTLSWFLAKTEAHFLIKLFLIKKKDVSRDFLLFFKRLITFQCLFWDFVICLLYEKYLILFSIMFRDKMNIKNMRSM